MTTSNTMAISDKLQKIKKKIATLNTKTDALNVTVVHIEDELRGSGVEFWWDAHMLRPDITRGDEGAGYERAYYVLGYTKIGTDWCLAVQAWEDIEEIGPNDQPGQFDEFHSLRVGDPVPLTRAPRLVRVAVADVLEKFLDALDAEIDRMEKALDKANALMGGASPEDMKRLQLALKTQGERVEIARHVGSPSASLELAQRSSEAAASLNASGHRIARIIGAKGREFECGVSAEQVRDLLALGAKEATR